MKTFDQIDIKNQVELLRQEVFRRTKGAVEEIKFTVETGNSVNFKIKVRGVVFEGNMISDILSEIEDLFTNKKEVNPEDAQADAVFAMLPFVSEEDFLKAVKHKGDKFSKSYLNLRAIENRNRLSNIDDHFDKTFE